MMYFFLTILLFLASPAHSAGTASKAPPPAPVVDFSALPASATVRPINADEKPHQVEARLLADRDQLQAGTTARIGLHLTQDPGWHTYWKSNVEVGQPTQIEWEHPSAFTHTPYAYPIPQRFDTQGIVSFGYDKEVLLFTELTIPADTPAGDITLGATASWLACEITCIPAVDVKLSLPMTIVAADSEPVPANAYAPLFDHYAKQHPTPQSAVKAFTFEGTMSPPELKVNTPFKVTYKLTPAQGITLTSHEGDDPWPTFTPIVSNAEYYLDLTSMDITEAGGLHIVMEGETFEIETLPKDMKVGGLFQIQAGDTLVQTEMTMDMPWTATTAPAPTKETANARYSLEELGSAELDEATCALIANPPEQTSSLGTMAFMLLMAFLGGLLLNIMPCVLPVLTLKLYGLIEQADISKKERQKAGMAYTAGIVASFLALAIVVVTLQNVMGQDVGWGFQFQYPMYTAALASIVFVFGLSLFGVFEIPAFGSDQAAGAGAKEGLMGYFFTGVFATLLATPCSAPFLGTAMGFAFAQPSVFVLLFFSMAGLGLASPFIAIAFIPTLFKLMPRPGAWMETFKQFMGFTLIATTAWLIDVLAAQITVDATVGFVAFLCVLSFSAWVFGHWAGVAASATRMLTVLAISVGVSGLGGWAFLDFSEIESRMEDVSDGKIHWKIFTEDRMASVLNRYREGEDKYFAGRPIFLDFTAEWCLSCKVNEKTIIETETVAAAFKEYNVVPIKGDWTNRDENITKWLRCFQRAGVPYYAVLPANPSEEAILLGETVTAGSITAALKAGAGQ